MDKQEKPNFAQVEQLNDEKRLKEIKEQIFVNEVPGEYKKLSQNARLIELQEPYAENLINKFQAKKGLTDLGKIMADSSRDGIVLDLGCGQTDYLSRFFTKNGAKLYIGVDLHPYVFTPEVIVENEENCDHLYMVPPSCLNPKEPSIQSATTANNIDEFQCLLKRNVLQLTSDMLMATSSMKDESVDSIIISGIEMSSENLKETEKYLDALENEIKRVLKKSGIALVNNSDFCIKDFAVVVSDKHNNDWMVFKKVI